MRTRKKLRRGGRKRFSNLKVKDYLAWRREKDEDPFTHRRDPKDLPPLDNPATTVTSCNGANAANTENTDEVERET